MGCGGCGKARAAMAAKIQEQAKLRELSLAKLPPDQKLTVMPHVPAVPVVPAKTPRQLRIEARNLRIARRIARQKAMEAKQGNP